MSFLNQDVDNKFCCQCRHKDKPYMNSYGIYSQCLECVNGSNMEKSNKPLDPDPEKKGQVS